ncbi:MAG TPA: hypothetical protein VFP14_00540 [Novosphingobium sp.]|nr:hypothetical protein [Novosphingobium sp.]
MSILWTDWRKTALGALALALFAVMFTHQGGVAETAVTSAEDIAGRKQEAIQAGAEAHKAWFAADEASYEVEAAPPVPRATAPEPLTASPEAVRNPEPSGPDFPAGLAPPG